MERKGGVKPKTEDKRDFKLSAAYVLPKLSELPDTFSLGAVDILDQKSSPFCSAFATAGASALQEGVDLVPEFIYAAIGAAAGHISLEGYELREAMQAHVKIGAIEEKDRPQGYMVGMQSDDFLADMKNWPVELLDKALEHSKKTFVSVDGQYDHFDNIRASIWLFRNEKRAPVFGLRWGWDATTPKVENPIDQGFGHALYALGGWHKDYLEVPNSWGVGAGDSGKFYIHRNVINMFVETYGAFMFIDLTKEEYLQRVEDKKRQLTIIGQILSVIAKLIPLFADQINSYLKKKDNPAPVIPPVPPPPIPPTPVPPSPVIPPAPPVDPVEVLKWDTRLNSLHSARVIMDMWGLSWAEKDQLCSVICGESEFNINAIHVNANGSTDYGIVQVNDARTDDPAHDYWIGIGKYFATPEEVLTNPVKCINFICKMYKAGKLIYWMAYKNGGYQKFLNGKYKPFLAAIDAKVGQ